MTSLFARLLTFSAVANPSPSCFSFLPRASISKKAKWLLTSAVLGVQAMLVVGAVCVPAHAQLNWVQESQAGKPLERDAHAMAYDAAHDNVVLFGGFNGAVTDLNHTWVWDGFPLHPRSALS
jgi:hypothetical protein